QLVELEALPLLGTHPVRPDDREGVRTSEEIPLRQMEDTFRIRLGMAGNLPACVEVHVIPDVIALKVNVQPEEDEEDEWEDAEDEIIFPSHQPPPIRILCGIILCHLGRTNHG